MVARRKLPTISDFAIAEDCHDHRKIRKLRRLTGDDFYLVWWSLTRLWRWATCRGGFGANFNGYLGGDPELIADEIQWDGDAMKILGPLEESGFLEQRDGGWWIHHFHESQPHVEPILQKLKASRENGRRGGRPRNPAITKKNPGKPSGNPEEPRRTQANLEKPYDADADADDDDEVRKESIVDSAKPKATSWMEKILSEWNRVAIAKNYAGAGRKPLLTAKRRRSMAARPSEWKSKAMEAILRLEAKGKPFLSGENERGWKASIKWFLKPDTVSEILEGDWDDDQTRNIARRDKHGRPYDPKADPHSKTYDPGYIRPDYDRQIDGQYTPAQYRAIERQNEERERNGST